MKHSGDWTIESGLLGKSKESALISSGSYGGRYKSIEWEFMPIKGHNHKLVFNMKDYGHFMAIGLSDEGIDLIEKNIEERVIEHWNFSDFEEKIVLKLTMVDDKIIMLLNNKEYLISTIDILKNLYGIYLGKNTINLSIGFKIS